MVMMQRKRHRQEKRYRIKYIGMKKPNTGEMMQPARSTEMQ
jgi:hypothetical protein